jgi:hypothetical protein
MSNFTAFSKTLGPVPPAKIQLQKIRIEGQKPNEFMESAASPATAGSHLVSSSSWLLLLYVVLQFFNAQTPSAVLCAVQVQLLQRRPL